MEPPFIVGKVVRPPYFINREKEIDRLANSLGSLSENQLVVAIRRMGKSSLLANAVEAMGRRNPDVLVASIDCRRITNLESFVDEIVQETLLAYKDRHPVAGWTKLKSRLWKDRITDLLPEIQRIGGSVGDMFSAYLELREKKIDPNKFVTQAFQFLERFTRERKEGLAMILDEFQELDKLQAPFLFQMFKSYGDRLQRVRFCFSGSSVSLLSKIFLQPDSPLYLTAGKVPLGPLDPATVAKFMQDRFRAAGMTIDAAASDSAHALTGGIPYYVQKVGLNAWLQCLAAHRNHVDAATTQKAFDDMLWEFASEFEARFEHKYGAQQKAILLQLAAHGPLNRSQLAKSTQRPTGTLSQGLVALETAMEVRKPARGRYEMCDPVFATWIRTTVTARPGAVPPPRKRRRSPHTATSRD